MPIPPQLRVGTIAGANVCFPPIADIRPKRILSLRRIEAVRAALVRRGYAGTFTTEVHGEEGPLVQTDDGIVEPQNRRVEIVMVCFRNVSRGFEYMRCPQ